MGFRPNRIQSNNEVLALGADQALSERYSSGEWPSQPQNPQRWHWVRLD